MKRQRYGARRAPQGAQQPLQPAEIWCQEPSSRCTTACSTLSSKHISECGTVLGFRCSPANPQQTSDQFEEEGSRMVRGIRWLRRPSQHCRVTISNTVFGKFLLRNRKRYPHFAVSASSFCRPAKLFVGFQTVILELGESTISMEA